ncbi:excisionase family DNA-binding protein [Paenarthrobacter sp. 22069]|uniref:excisionase family DNA-binding protein n=1 Tax=Paenarthrobacter sp. 22069 TaxID=3453864 RepID=UPI003F87595B
MNDAAGGSSGNRRRRFLTIEQVAEELNVGLPTVRALLSAGEMRGIQVGTRGLWRVGSADLDQYISNAYAQTAERIARGELADVEASSP